jgi:hypothetical protein
MEAVVGDRIVVAAAMLNGPLRDGEMIQVGQPGKTSIPRTLVRRRARDALLPRSGRIYISHHESLAEPAAAETASAGAVSAADIEAVEGHEVHRAHDCLVGFRGCSTSAQIGEGSRLRGLRS